MLEQNKSGIPDGGGPRHSGEGLEMHIWTYLMRDGKYNTWVSFNYMRLEKKQ